MIARHHGEERVHSRWRPRPLAPRASRPAEVQSLEPAETRQHPRKPGPLIVVVTVVVVAVIAGQQQHGGRTQTGRTLPSTPQQWVQQWTAASLENPGRVCGHLFSVVLARAFKADTGHSCAAYSRKISSASFRIRHILKDGDATVVEAREIGAVGNRRYVTVLLSHVADGWHAIDIVPGNSVRSR
jgi:hypothetical protein